MKITLSIDSKETITINHSEAANIVNWIVDCEQNATFFSILAKHASSEVRCMVANKSNIPLKVMEKLARDSSIEVVRILASNETALRKLKLPLFKEMINRDVSVATTIADNLYIFGIEHLDIREELMLELFGHPDPNVVDIVLNFEREQLGSKY